MEEGMMLLLVLELLDQSDAMVGGHYKSKINTP